MDWGLDGGEFGGVRMAFGSIGASEKKGGYLVIGWEDNEGMRGNMGTLSLLSTLPFLIMVIFLKGREPSFLLPLFSFSHTHTQINTHAPNCPVLTPPFYFYYWEHSIRFLF